VQSAGGAIYLRANAPILPTRLQLQDVESGALILLDIAAELAKAGQPALEPVRIVEGDVPATRYGEPAKPAATADDDAERTAPAAKHATPVAVVLTRYAAQNLYAPLRTVEPVPGIGRVNLRRGLELSTLLPTLPVRAQALAAWRLEDQWVTAVKLMRVTSSARPSSTRIWPQPASPPTPRWSTSLPVATAWPSRCCPSSHRSTRR
jgi:integrating conjugative element protein (TIGR03749 family)